VQREAELQRRQQQAAAERQKQLEQQQVLEQQQRQANAQRQAVITPATTYTPVTTVAPVGFAPATTTGGSTFAPAPTRTVNPAYTAAPTTVATAPVSGYAPAPANNSMQEFGQPLTQCGRLEMLNDKARLTNACTADINVIYCLVQAGGGRCNTDGEFSRKALPAREHLERSYRAPAQFYYMACADGYTPTFQGWNGDVIQGRCELGSDISLLKNWDAVQTSMINGAPAVDICIRDNECEDGDILAVSVNNREVMRREILNKAYCERVAVVQGNNNVSILAVNGTGHKGNCSFLNRNTGEIAVYGVNPDGSRASSQTQGWQVPGGAGSSSTMPVFIRN
jgi:hypothetical protein